MRFHSVVKEARKRALREMPRHALNMPLGNMWANAAGKCRQNQLIACHPQPLWDSVLDGLKNWWCVCVCVCVCVMRKVNGD